MSQDILPGPRPDIDAIVRALPGEYIDEDKNEDIPQGLEGGYTNYIRALDSFIAGYEPGQRESTNVEIAPTLSSPMTPDDRRLNPGAANERFIPKATNKGMRLVDFRKEYPQYDDMDDTTLGAALHKKFYSDIDKDEFNRLIGIAGGNDDGVTE